MIVEREYYVKLSEIGKENKLTNKSLLGILEDIGGIHSNYAGYGIPDMEKTRLSWVLIDWKVQVIRRPNYGEKIVARTWSKPALKCYAFRDFEVLDENKNVIVKAISKWVLINIDTGKLERVEGEVVSKFKPELERTVFEDESFEKLKEPERCENIVDYQIKRGDIDVNHHLHNINYLDLANEALPDDVYNNFKEFDSFRITYKKEIKLGEISKCKYHFENGKHIITIKNEDDSKLHSIIVLE